MLRFVHLSDPHLRLDDTLAHGVSVNRRFRQALLQVSRMDPTPTFCIITGDLVAEEHGAPPARIQFVVLDSRQEGEVSGRLGATQLAWLQNVLHASRRKDGDTNHIIFLHHPPLSAPLGFADDMRLLDAKAFVDVLLQSEANIGRVLFGHLHQALTFTTRGISMTAAPSTGYQFTDGEVTPPIFSGPGAYQVVTVHDQAVLTTVVVPIIEGRGESGDGSSDEASGREASGDEAWPQDSSLA